MRRLTSLLIPLVCLIFQGGLALLYFSEEDQFFKYSDAALQSLSGSLPVERLADLSPLYFYLHRLFASQPGLMSPLLLGAQLLATALSAGLLYALLCRFVATRLAVAGAVAFILSRSVVVYACIFEPETFLLLFLLAFISFSLDERNSRRLAAGLFLSLCLLIRPNLLPFLVLTPLWFFLRGGRSGWLRQSLLFLVLPLLALLLLSARNASLLGTFSPVVMNPGYVFYEGNNPLSSGQSAIYPPLVGEMKTELSEVFDNPHVTYRELARRISGQNLSVPAVNSFWGVQALHYMMDYPGAFLQNMGIKAVSLVHSDHRYDLDGARVFDQRLARLWLPFVPFAGLAVFGLFGMVADRKQWQQWLLPALVIASQAGVMLIMYVSDRQRLPLVPFLILFACLGVKHLLGLPMTKRALLCAVLVAGAVLLSLPTAKMRDGLYLWQRFSASDQAWVDALEARSRGDWGLAAVQAARSYGNAPWLKDYSRPAFIPFGKAPQSFARAALRVRVDEADDSPSSRFDRAALLLDAGRPDAARPEFLALLKEGVTFDRGYLQSSHPGYYLARAELLRGDRPAAITVTERTLRDAPGDPFLLALLGALTGEERYERRIGRYFSPADAAMLSGVVLLDIDQPVAAAERFRYVLQVLPELRRAKIYLAAALGAMGQVEPAVALYGEALKGRVDPVLLEEKILAIYREFVRRAPDDPHRIYAYGAVLAQYGHLTDALELQRAAYDATGNEAWSQSLRWLEQLVAQQKSGQSVKPIQ